MSNYPETSVNKKEEVTELESIKIHNLNISSDIEKILRRLKNLVIKLDERHSYPKKEEISEEKHLEGLIPSIKSSLNNSHEMVKDIYDLVEILERII